jgi:hypothetical protein
MRPLLSILGAIALLGAIYGYTRFADRTKASAPIAQLTAAIGHFSAEVTCSFDCRADERFEIPALEIRLGAATILRPDPVPRWTTVRVDPLPNVVRGRNEIVVQCSIAAESESGGAGNGPGAAGCVRVRVFQDGAPLAEQTVWSEPGHPLVVGALLFSADEATGGSP